MAYTCLVTRNKHIATIEELITWTNYRIQGWYDTVKIDYGVIGSGTTQFNKLNNQITVNYTEDGENKTWSMYFHTDFLRTQKIDWVFQCWSELA